MKRIWISAVTVILMLLFFPYSTEYYAGGTTITRATTYAFAQWHSHDGTFENCRIFWFPDSLQNIDNLQKLEYDLRLESIG